MRKELEKQRKAILKILDRLDSYEKKLEFINDRYIAAKSESEENMILDIIKRLKNGF